MSVEAEDPLPKGMHDRVFKPVRVRRGQDRRSIAKHQRFTDTLQAATQLVRRYPVVPHGRETPASFVLKEVDVEPLPNVVDMQGQPMEIVHRERVAIPLSGVVSIYPASQRRTAS